VSVHNIKYRQPIGCEAQLAAQLYIKHLPWWPVNTAN